MVAGVYRPHRFRCPGAPTSLRRRLEAPAGGFSPRRRLGGSARLRGPVATWIPTRFCPSSSSSSASTALKRHALARRFERRDPGHGCVQRDDHRARDAVDLERAFDHDGELVAVEVDVVESVDVLDLGRALRALGVRDGRFHQAPVLAELGESEPIRPALVAVETTGGLDQALDRRRRLVVKPVGDRCCPIRIECRNRTTVEPQPTSMSSQSTRVGRMSMVDTGSSTTSAVALVGGLMNSGTRWTSSASAPFSVKRSPGPARSLHVVGGDDQHCLVPERAGFQLVEHDPELPVHGAELHGGPLADLTQQEVVVHPPPKARSRPVWERSRVVGGS